MKVNDTIDPAIMHLTYDEEIECARKFCVMLDLLWIEDQPKLYKPLCRLFFKKSQGWDFLVNEFMELDDAILNHNEDIDTQYIEYHGLPDLCEDLAEDGDAINFGVAPANLKGKETDEERKLRYRREVARAWKEAWQERPKGYLHERFPTFPGELLLNPGPTANERRERDMEIERKFWDMVDEKQSFFSCSREQAIIEVSDYMPRAIFDDNRLRDPNPKRVIKPVIEMDEWESERQNEIDDQIQSDE